MFDAKIASDRLARTRSRLPFRPTAESLEDRLLLYATTGGSWSHPERISYSIVPDGTSIGGTPSTLVQSMLSKYGNWDWLNGIRQSAAAWQAAAKVNLSFSSWDNGAPLSSDGYQQGDSHFGDIRIGGAPLAAGVLALCYATPPYNGGTLAGDIVFNINQPWNSTFDITTVAVHEFGHALGLDHSGLTSAVMYAVYNQTKTSLTSDDVLGVQAIYGAPAQDVFDAANSNNAFTSASPINGTLDSQGKATVYPLDLTGVEQDWYSVVAPASTTGTLTATIQSTNISSLSPRLWICKSPGPNQIQILASNVAADSYGATISASVNNVVPGETYYVRAAGATSYGADGQGSYVLQVNFGSGSQTAFNPNTVVLAQPNQAGGSYNTFLAESIGVGPGPASDENADADNELIRLGTLEGQGDLLMIGDLEMPATAPAATSIDAGASTEDFEGFALDQTILTTAAGPSAAASPTVAAPRPARVQVRSAIDRRSPGARPNGGVPVASRGPSWWSSRRASSAIAGRVPRGEASTAEPSGKLADFVGLALPDASADLSSRLQTRAPRD